MSAVHVEAGLDRLAALAGASKALAPQVARIAGRYIEILRGGGTLYFCGNGGSAADAQHVAAEYVVRYASNRRALAAVALTTDTSLLTVRNPSAILRDQPLADVPPLAIRRTWMQRLRQLLGGEV